MRARKSGVERSGSGSGSETANIWCLPFMSCGILPTAAAMIRFDWHSSPGQGSRQKSPLSDVRSLNYGTPICATNRFVATKAIRATNTTCLMARYVISFFPVSETEMQLVEWFYINRFYFDFLSWNSFTINESYWYCNEGICETESKPNGIHA